MSCKRWAVAWQGGQVDPCRVLIVGMGYWFGIFIRLVNGSRVEGYYWFRILGIG